MPRPVKLVLCALFPVALVLAPLLTASLELDEELKNFSGKGPADGYFGGYLVVVPFVLGTGVGVIHGSLEGLYGVAFWGAPWAWACPVYHNEGTTRLTSCTRVKGGLLLSNRGTGRMDYGGAEWLFLLFGVNFVCGIRQVHFLSAYWARQRGEELQPDAFADFFPFVTVETLTLQDLVSKPELLMKPVARLLTRSETP
eukprot:scaffold237_cov421-Prasinococcus_capsulatus_cf.AAC.14